MSRLHRPRTSHYAGSGCFYTEVFLDEVGQHGLDPHRMLPGAPGGCSHALALTLQAERLRKDADAPEPLRQLAIGLLDLAATRSSKLESKRLPVSLILRQPWLPTAPSSLPCQGLY